MGSKFILLVFFEELLGAVVWLTWPKGSRVWFQKRSLFYRFLLFIFTSFFPHVSTWCNLQRGSSNLKLKSLTFFKKLCNLHSIGVLGRDHLLLAILRVRFEPCVLKWIYKWSPKDPPKNKIRWWPSSFMNFKMRSCIMKGKKSLMFKCYNLMNSMEEGVVTYWSWFPTIQIQDPTITSLSLHFIFFEKKLISLTISKIALFWQKKHKEF
jgi:hypothetical protein